MRHQAARSVVLALSVLVTLAAVPAQAFSIRQHAAACNEDGQGFVSNVAGWVSTGAGTIVVNCAIPDSDSLLPQDMHTINVHVYDGSTTDSVSATVYTTFWAVNGGTVKTPKVSGGANNPAFTGNTVLNLGGSLSPSDFHDFKFVRLFIPGVSGTSRSNFRGIFYAD
jgi:hypothetical protein